VTRSARWAVLGLLCLAVPALAQDRRGHHCRVPLSDWQPRNALQSKLELQGWTVLSIRADDGCYQVRATTESGQRFEGKFNPATLEPVAPHGEGEDGED
jgi:hypothetical protein